MKLPWKIEKLLGYRPNKVYKDIFEFQRSGHKSLVGLRKIDSSRLFHLKLPKYSNVALPERFHINHFKAYPDVYLAELKHVRVGMVDFRVGVITADNGLLLDLSPDHARKTTHPFLTHSDCRATKTLKGKTLVLAAPTGKGNYYHWMFHVIGRFSVLKVLEMNLDEFDHILVPKTYASFQQQSLVDFNFPVEKIVYLDNNEFIEIEHATVPSYLYFHPMVPHFLRRSYLHQKLGDYPKKIYISRRKSKIRKLLEEDFLVEILVNEFGYKEIFLEDLTLQEQANTLNRADFVIAPHGAGVPNIIYCKPATKVIEIIPYSWINVIYWIYAEYQKLDYHAFLTGDSNDTPNGYKDFNVNLEEFKAFLIKHKF
jgi:capsular polysaccharide biosynthesis protein